MVRGRSPAYSSFGVASLNLPIKLYEQAIEASKAKSAKKILSDLLTSSSNSKDLVTSSTQICEEQFQGVLAEYLIQSLIINESGEPLELKISLHCEVEERTKLANEIEAKHYRARMKLANEAGLRLADNYKQLYESLVERVDSCWKQAIGCIGGLDNTSSILEKLLEELKDGHDYLEARCAKEERELDYLIEWEFPKLRNDLMKATRAFQFINKHGSIVRVCQQYENAINREFSLYIQVAVDKKALEAIAILTSYVNQIQQRCADARAILSAASNQIIALPVTKAIEFKPNPFERIIPDGEQSLEFDEPIIGSAHFTEWYEQNYGSFLSFLEKTSLEVINIIRFFVDQCWHSIPSYTIDKVLRNMDSQNLQLALKRLWELAAPLRSYDTSLIPLPYRTIVEASFFGVEDAQTTILKSIDEEILSRNVAASFISINDPYHLVLFRVKSGVPLFALRGIEEMQETYCRLPNRALSHIDFRWVKFPDLIPLEDSL